MRLPIRWSILVSLFLATLCPAADKPLSKDESLQYLKTVLPEPLFQYAGLEVASEKSIAIVSGTPRNYLAFRILPDQPKVNGGIRSELSVNYPFAEGDTVRYSWRFMFPADFVSDAPTNRWWLAGQWHDQPNTSKGETWANFPSRSPPVALGLREADQRLQFLLYYGTPQSHKVGPIPIDRGRWYRISVLIHWSRQADGRASVFLDDAEKPVLSADGPNMNNPYQHYLKLGMYRDPEINTDNSIFVSDVAIEKPKP